MKTQLFPIDAIIIISTLYLFQGCSRHVLQDLIDNNHVSNTSSQQELSSPKKTPSENRALNSISPTSTSDDKHKEHRYLQKSIINKEINSDDDKKKIIQDVTESNITKHDNNDSSKYNSTLDDNSSFTLQHYVDKLGEYMDEKEQRDTNKSKKSSHVEELQSMPGIGTAKTRR